MLKANFVTGTQVPANTNIPLVAVKNTNRRAVVDGTDNTIKIVKSGDIYSVDAVLVATASAATAATAQLYENGNPVPGAIATVVPAAVGDAMIFPLQDIFRVIPAPFGEYADISFRVNQAVTPTGGNVIVKFER